MLLYIFYIRFFNFIKFNYVGNNIVAEMENGKAYIVITPKGIGKTKTIDIELINLVSDDREVLTLAQGVWWFAKNSTKLATYIGMREFERILLGEMKDDKKLN